MHAGYNLGNYYLKYYLFLLLLLSIVILFCILYESKRMKKEKLARGEVVGFWNERERRRFKRIKIAFEVRYEITENTKVLSEVLSRDVSQGGIGLIIYEKLKEGTPLRIWLNLPGRKDKLFVLGDIAWLKEVKTEDSDKRVFYAGVRFTTVDTKTQVQFFDFIAKLEKEEDYIGG